MKKLNIGVLFSILLLCSLNTIQAQEKTAKCNDFEGYIYTYSYSNGSKKSEYSFVLRFKGVLSEDCKIYYQTANKNSNFKWPTTASRKTLEKGQTEYVISKNGFYYGNYKDRHRVFSYPIGKKFKKDFWKNVIGDEYESLDWKITTDSQEIKY
ncbi:MAG: hypothetical protein CMC13_16125 [Flavobacteriaceae bacterium]|nr:hypothetical protein [Flavobacteriaceae bacterium]|tara:strand:+ start:1569 stop:2027 length:459 start_codon:yes stop_codon:yes gene_type:complete